jgi:hypothetical protein
MKSKKLEEMTDAELKEVDKCYELRRILGAVEFWPSRIATDQFYGHEALPKARLPMKVIPFFSGKKMRRMWRRVQAA